ncbi:hypothetical protein [Streptomyces fuscigenes]|uniref:hypothetical protein n=1 Tax=Streptomyces fuscigenes TaxID=1528880 RepID=UPI001F1964C7|nr:hypothetical protein [Streptomyces fuscigenes]MCF3961074.1 hypothetical protein [Streptomyces fuscigenes]
MACDNFSAALPARAHPAAKPGYGKRSAPEQRPRGEADFGHLRTREAAVAAYIDRLPEGAAIGYKALAAHLADYGQQACGKALNFLSDAGHLRRIKEHLQLDDNTFRWVTHTFYSRTARDDDWWRGFVAGMRGIDLTERARRAREATARGGSGGCEASPAPEPPGAGEGTRLQRDPEADGDAEAGPEASADAVDEPCVPAVAAVAAVPAVAPVAPVATGPVLPPAPSDAYRALQRLGRTEPRMTLSAAECAALEPLAAQWFARGATPEHLTRSLTEGLPHPLHSPGAIARTRLEKKMPPEPLEERAYVRRAVMVCMTCDVPDNVSPLINGVCVECREEMTAYEAAEEAGVVIDRVPDTFRRVPAQVDVARRADELRAAAGMRARPIPQPTQGSLARGGTR